MREKPLIPWIFAEEDGRIIFGHCNCMAGLGESCSHIGFCYGQLKLVSEFVTP